jgi:outer membrane lipoprotein carrier protein
MFAFVSLLAAPLVAADLSATLKAVETHYNRPRTIQLVFYQSFKGDGRISREESGDLFLSRPGRMFWRYQEPLGKQFLVDGRFVWFYSPTAGKVEKSVVNQSEDLRAPLAFLLGRLDFFKFFKEFRHREEAGDLIVVAQPKSEKAPYAAVEFRINAQNQIRHLRVTGQDRSIMDFRFTSEVLNPKIDPKLFVFQQPEGVKIVEVADQ